MRTGEASPRKGTPAPARRAGAPLKEAGDALRLWRLYPRHRLLRTVPRGGAVAARAEGVRAVNLPAPAPEPYRGEGGVAHAAVAAPVCERVGAHLLHAGSAPGPGR